MKKILFMLAAMSVLASCCVDREIDSSYWGNRKWQKWESYPEDIMSECVRKPILTLDYVLRLQQTLDAAGVNLGSGTYVVSDVFGNQVGPIECLVFGNDTTWFFDSGKYIVKHESADSWKVTTDYKDETSVFRYDFELHARQTAEVGDSVVHRPWNVEVSGKRIEEGSDYRLEFHSGEIRSSCERPKSFNSSISLKGVLGIRFYRSEKELDWLEATYGGDSVIYRKSF